MGRGPRFHILSPWIFQNHSPLHLMSVTNSPGTIFGETLCDRIARFIFRLDRGNLPTTLGWKTLWMTVMLSLERWFQEVLVLYLPVDSWVRIPVAPVPASLRPRGENCFFCFFCCNCTPLSWKKNESLQSTRPCSHLYCFQARITSVGGYRWVKHQKKPEEFIHQGMHMFMYKS